VLLNFITSETVDRASHDLSKKMPPEGFHEHFIPVFREMFPLWNYTVVVAMPKSMQGKFKLVTPTHFQDPYQPQNQPQVLSY
jgi:hypothetical protein